MFKQKTEHTIRDKVFEGKRRRRKQKKLKRDLKIGREREWEISEIAPFNIFKITDLLKQIMQSEDGSGSNRQNRQTFHTKYKRCKNTDREREGVKKN